MGTSTADLKIIINTRNDQNVNMLVCNFQIFCMELKGSFFVKKTSYVFFALILEAGHNMFSLHGKEHL